MKIQEKLNKIKSIVNSCETYPQLQSCISFATSRFFQDATFRIIVLNWITDRKVQITNSMLSETNL
jgi:hypothetical protein